jgi:DNA-binding transcriptional LysR family regulator
MSRIPFNGRHPRALRDAAGPGGVSVVAPRVSLSRPAITQAISKLQATLGLHLFIRRCSGKFLAEPGRLFRKRAEQLLSLLSIARMHLFFAMNRYAGLENQ